MSGYVGALVPSGGDASPFGEMNDGACRALMHMEHDDCAGAETDIALVRL